MCVNIVTSLRQLDILNFTIPAEDGVTQQNCVMQRKYNVCTTCTLLLNIILDTINMPNVNLY